MIRKSKAIIAYREEMSSSESISKKLCLKTTFKLLAERLVSPYGDYVIIFKNKLGWNREYTLAPLQGREFLFLSNTIKRRKKDD